MAGKRWKNVKPCGTRAAYKRHLEHGEDPCDECTEANRLKTAQYRAKAQKVKS